jgi:hypothetical protein
VIQDENVEKEGRRHERREIVGFSNYDLLSIFILLLKCVIVRQVPQ